MPKPQFKFELSQTSQNASRGIFETARVGEKPFQGFFIENAFSGKDSTGLSAGIRVTKWKKFQQKDIHKLMSIRIRIAQENSSFPTTSSYRGNP